MAPKLMKRPSLFPKEVLEQEQEVKQEVKQEEEQEEEASASASAQWAKGGPAGKAASASAKGGPAGKAASASTKGGPAGKAASAGDKHLAKMESSKALQEKIAEFQRIVKAKKLQETPTVELIKSHFTPAEMSALWGKLASARGKHTLTVKDFRGIVKLSGNK